jgi:signal transduction histidine kinase
MFSLRWIRALYSRSLYGGVIVAMTLTLSLSFVAFHLISKRLQDESINPIFRHMDEFQLRSSKEALERGGKPALRDYLANVNDVFGGMHFLLDARGIDLVTGQDKSTLLPASPDAQWRVPVQGHWIIAHRSTDGRFWFVVEHQIGRPETLTFLPYYFLVIAATGVLCWIASATIISPIRRIEATIAAFGHENLSVRIDTSRQDEIGSLALSFNKMADRLERVIVRERRLLADMSHELRSPLARLKFAIRLARNSEDREFALDRIDRDVNRISALVSDLLEMNAMECEPTIKKKDPVPIGEIVDEVFHDCSLEAEFRGCSIAMEGAFTSNVVGDRELLRRAFENVLRNGIRYSPRDAVVRVKLVETNCAVVIEVRDLGPGVPPELLSKIFDPFFRADEARIADGGGSGLGLSIAKRALLLHEGSIEAENAAPGLRIRLVIPSDPASA